MRAPLQRLQALALRSGVFRRGSVPSPGDPVTTWRCFPRHPRPLWAADEGHCWAPKTRRRRGPRSGVLLGWSAGDQSPGVPITPQAQKMKPVCITWGRQEGRVVHLWEAGHPPLRGGAPTPQRRAGPETAQAASQQLPQGSQGPRGLRARTAGEWSAGRCGPQRPPQHQRLSGPEGPSRNDPTPPPLDASQVSLGPS